MSVTFLTNEDKAVLDQNISELSEEIDNFGVLFEDAKLFYKRENLFPPEYVRNSRYEYETGAVRLQTGTAVRNAVPLPVKPNTAYSIQEFTTTNKRIYVFMYNAEMVLVTPYISADRFIHFTTPENTAYLNFFIAEWTTTIEENPTLMIWESEDESEKLEFVPYSEEAALESFEVPKLSVPEAEKNKKNILAMRKASFDDSFNFIAYSSIDEDGGNINTAEHFNHCAKLRFTSLKGDVRPTLDGGLVMCHDAGFTLNDDGHVVGYDANNAVMIRTLTMEQCKELQHRNGDKIIDFETYIRICKKYGKVAFITIRDEYIDDVIAALFPILDKYSMRQRSIINSMTYASLQAVRKVDEDIMLCSTNTSGNNLTRNSIDKAWALGNCIANGFDFPSFGGLDDLDAISDVLQYAHEKGVRVYEAIANSTTTIDSLMERGIMGAHLTFVPDL